MKNNVTMLARDWKENWTVKQLFDSMDKAKKLNPGKEVIANEDFNTGGDDYLVVFMPKGPTKKAWGEELMNCSPDDIHYDGEQFWLHWNATKITPDSGWLPLVGRGYTASDFNDLVVWAEDSVERHSTQSQRDEAKAEFTKLLATFNKYKAKIKK